MISGSLVIAGSLNGEAYTVTLSRQVGILNQAGQGNSQTINLKLVQHLRLCQANCESLKRALALCQALVVAKGETISLLRGGDNRPN